MPSKRTKKGAHKVGRDVPIAPLKGAAGRPSASLAEEVARREVPVSPDTAEKVRLLRELAQQIAELREMNVDILSKATFIQAALDTLLTIHAGVDAGTRDLYASYFFSSRETIAAGMRHLGMQQALEKFLNRTQLDSGQDQAAAA